MSCYFFFKSDGAIEVRYAETVIVQFKATKDRGKYQELLSEVARLKSSV